MPGHALHECCIASEQLQQYLQDIGGLQFDHLQLLV
jgi:hypothetical protein